MTQDSINRPLDRKPRPILFGEVLWDCFPDGTEVLGGAPFNVAWHLHGLGLNPLLISRVGADDHGKRIRRRMSDWGMDLSGLQTDEDYPTGRVQIEWKGDSHEFHILPDQAYDRVDSSAALNALRYIPTSLLVHGTLALRNRENENTLRRIRLATHATVFLDVNLRAPWWRRVDVVRAVQRAHYVKLNDEELNLLMECDPPAKGDALRGLARTFSQRNGIAVLMVTMGAEGSFEVHTGGSVFEEPHSAGIDVVDTVGAGDAFSAMAIKGALAGWKPEDTLRRAAEFAADVCRIRGATTDDPELYKNR